MALTKGKAPWDLEKQSFVDVRSFAVYPTNTAAENNVAIQGAIDASPGQTLIFPSGIYNLSSTLTGLETVDLIGGDPGRQSQPVSSPDVELSWSGGASPILKYGGGASTVTGGKIEGFRINGNALASQGIQIKDHQHGTFKRLQVSDVTSAGIYMTNTNTYAEPTGFSEFEDIQIMLRGGSTNSANGINLDGFLGAGVQGVTLCSFNKIRIEHANGSGVLFGEAGDGMTFKNLLTFRADAEAGFGLYAGSTAATQGILNNVFINLVASGGVRIETANTAYWTIVGLNDIDTNTSIDPVVSGPGAGEVNVLTSISGKLSGLGRLDNNRTYKHSDNMFFKQYDATNSLVHTAETTYKVGGTFAGSNISDAGIAGGALSMATAAGLNDILYLTTGSGSFTDYFYGQYPEMAISFVPVVFTGALFQFGFMNTADGSPTEGMYIEADTATNSNWQLKCVKAGTTTTVISSLAVAVANIQFRIVAGTDAVTFLYRAGGQKSWAVLGKITTNLPTGNMSAVIFAQALTASSKSAFIYNLKTGADLEW